MQQQQQLYESLTEFLSSVNGIVTETYRSRVVTYGPEAARVCLAAYDRLSGLQPLLREMDGQSGEDPGEVSGVAG